MKKAAFFDIDGTILDHNNVIPKSTVEGIHKLQKKGHYAFLCTGRSRAHVKNPALLKIGFDGIVSGCGTMVEFQNEVLFYKKLDKEAIRQTVALLKEHRAPVILEGRFRLYADPEDFTGDLYFEKLRAWGYACAGCGQRIGLGSEQVLVCDAKCGFGTVKKAAL